MLRKSNRPYATMWFLLLNLFSLGHADDAAKAESTTRKPAPVRVVVKPKACDVGDETCSVRVVTEEELAT